MEKTVTFGGVQYVARRRSNLNKIDLRYYRRMVSLFYEVLALDLGYPLDTVATALVDYIEISAQVTGGTVLLTRQDSAEAFQTKCKAWLEDVDPDLGDLLIDAVNTVNATQPDRALAPEPLPDNADPK